jgi:hypothetical protein
MRNDVLEFRERQLREERQRHRSDRQQLRAVVTDP